MADTEGNERVPHKGAGGDFWKKYKMYIIGGIVIIGVLVFFFVRESNKNAAAATSTTATPTTTAASTEALNGIDPATGIPYADEYGALNNSLGAAAPASAGTTTTNNNYYSGTGNPASSVSGTPTSFQVPIDWVQGGQNEPFNADINNLSAYYNIPVSTIESANPQIPNFNQIGTGTAINIPLPSTAAA